MMSENAPQTAMCLAQEEWDMLANICRYYLRTTPPALPAQRALATRIIEASR